MDVRADPYPSSRARRHHRFWKWIDVEFEVALDSGATDNVCHKGDIAGYHVEQSPGSRVGQNFIVGDGSKISNDGQAHLNLQTMDASLNTLASTFQVAAVSRPLMSVGKLCDNGFDVIFKKTTAIVRAPDGATVCTFERQEGGLYVAKLRLKSPSPFARPS